MRFKTGQEIIDKLRGKKTTIPYYLNNNLPKTSVTIPQKQIIAIGGFYYSGSSAILDLLSECENVKSNDKIASGNMMSASHIAGKAINISRTTAAHAMSYTITSEYGIPHGHAVALSIGQLFEFNQKVNKLNYTDKRGVEFVKKIMKELSDLISTKPAEYFDNLLENIGLEYQFSKLNINGIELFIKAVNQERLNNNPINLEINDFVKILYTKEK